ncbi:hypothetical protein G9P44_000786 [Scheffersomyces stipitis]|nr:hypothetical protein G9P44_000786 [Scheffersomyces stipitis]
MTSLPSTPKTPLSRRSGKNGTPRTVAIAKTTALYVDEDSYVEEEDATYMYDETATISEEDDLEAEEIDEVSDEDFDLDDTEVENDEDISDKLEDLTPLQTGREEIPVSVSNTEAVEVGESKFRHFLIKHEIPRKAFHSSIGFFTLWLYVNGVQTRQLPLPLFAAFSMVFLNDFLRFRDPEFNRRVTKAMSFMMREKEVNEYNGTLFYLLGLTIVFAIFPKDICLMSVLLLSWADTAASTFGRQFGKYTPKITKDKSLAGSLAAFVTGVFSCYLLYGYFVPVYDATVNFPGDISWTAESSKLSVHSFALASGFIASVSEFINIFDLDDNFTIPVLSAFFLAAVVKIFHV